MFIMQLAIVLILGLIIGSFLNVCIYRIPREESIAYPPSHCTSCNTRLKPVDLIPVLSYLIYRGKCRYCGEKISIQYPVIEAINGIIYLLLFIEFGPTIIFIKYAVLSSLLIVISLIDYKFQSIYDNTILFGAAAGIIFNLINGYKYNFINGVIGLLIGGGIFLIIMLVTKGAMGGGDVELMAVLGFWLGWQFIILITILSFVIGAVISVVLIMLKIKGRKDYIPFGPFIAISALLVINYGNQIIEWYLRTILA